MSFFFLLIFSQSIPERTWISWQNCPARFCLRCLDADQTLGKQAICLGENKDKEINKCMKTVVQQKGHPGEEPFQQNCMILLKKNVQGIYYFCLNLYTCMYFCYYPRYSKAYGKSTSFYLWLARALKCSPSILHSWRQGKARVWIAQTLRARGWKRQI